MVAYNFPSATVSLPKLSLNSTAIKTPIRNMQRIQTHNCLFQTHNTFQFSRHPTPNISSSTLSVLIMRCCARVTGFSRERWDEKKQARVSGWENDDDVITSRGASRPRLTHRHAVSHRCWCCCCCCLFLNDSFDQVRRLVPFSTSSTTAAVGSGFRSFSSPLGFGAGILEWEDEFFEKILRLATFFAVILSDKWLVSRKGSTWEFFLLVTTHVWNGGNVVVNWRLWNYAAKPFRWFMSCYCVCPNSRQWWSTKNIWRLHDERLTSVSGLKRLELRGAGHRGLSWQQKCLTCGDVQAARLFVLQNFAYRCNDNEQDQVRAFFGHFVGATQVCEMLVIMSDQWFEQQQKRLSLWSVRQRNWSN